MDLLRTLKTANSYGIRYLYNGIEYEDYTTQFYYHVGMNMGGYLLIEAYDKAIGPTIAYNYEIRNGKVELLNPVTVSESILETKPVLDLDFAYYFRLLNEKEYENVGLSSFKVREDRVLYTEDEKLLYVLALNLGLGDQVTSKAYPRATFFLNGQNELVFQFQMPTPLGGYRDVSMGKGTVFSINSLKNETLDSFVSSSFRLKGERIVNERVKPLLHETDNDMVSLDSTAHVLIDDVDNGVSAQTRLDLSKEKAKTVAVDPLTLRETPTISVNHEGMAYYLGYDRNNTVTKEPYGKYYEWDLTFPTIESFLEKERLAFHLENNEYRYYGYELSTLFSRVTNMRIGAYPNQGYIELDSEGKATGFRFEFPLMRYEFEDGSFLFRYLVKTSIEEDRVIENLLPYGEEEHDSLLTDALEKLNGSVPFKAVIETERSPDNKDVVTYVENMYLLERQRMYLSGKTESEYDGYVEDNGLLKRFIILKDGTILPNGEPFEGSLREFLPKKMDSKILRKEGEGLYRFENHVLPGVKEALVKKEGKETLMPTSFEMRIDEERKRIESYSYKVLNLGLEDGKENVGFSYEGVSIDQAIQDKVLALPPFVKPTSWAEDDPSFAEKLVSLYGDEAQNVPYVYHPSTYKKWNSSLIIDTLDIWNTSKEGKDLEFFDLYKKALLEAGFTLMDPPELPGAEIYTKGKIKVRVARLLSGGLYFSLA